MTKTTSANSNSENLEKPNTNSNGDKSVLSPEENTSLPKTIDNIKNIVRQKKIDNETQAELARFLDLLTDLNMSEEKEISGQVEMISIAISSISNLDQQEQQQKIEFIREIRRIAEKKIRVPSNPLMAFAFWKTSTEPFHRLVSGVMCFLFLIIFVIPLGTFGWHRLFRNINENKQNLSQTKFEYLSQQLKQANSDLITLLANITALNSLASTQQDDIKKLCSELKGNSSDPEVQSTEEVQSSEREIKDLCSNLISKSSDSNPKLEDTNSSNNQTADSNKTISPLKKEKANTGATRGKATVATQKMALYNERKKFKNKINDLTKEYNSFLIKTIKNNKKLSEKHQEISGKIASLQTQEYSSLVSSLNGADSNEQKTHGLFANNYPEKFIFLWVLISGGVGGVVSVIVRTKELMINAESQGRDLFYVGFFRPLVGMSFGLFLICIIESGAFSNIISLKSEPADKIIYMYMAISFLAGISDVFTDNLVKTAESSINNKQSGR